jgi:hypothetical protein
MILPPKRYKTATLHPLGLKIMTFQIEVGVPLPTRKGGPVGKRGSKYPFATMEVGQSFLAPHGDEPIKQATLRSAIGAFYKANPDSGRKFGVREVSDDTLGYGVRVWRTE